MADAVPAPERTASAGGFANRWRGWRNRLLASPRFQAWAAAFPLTRPIARRRSRALFDLCAGFVYSQVLHAFVRLGLHERLADGPVRGDDLARGLGMAPDALDVLLRAAAALSLAECDRRGDWHLGVHGAALRAQPGVIAMIRHHALLYEDLADPVALLRERGAGTRLGAYWAYAEGGDDALSVARVRDYTALMAASQTLVADDVLAACDLGRQRRLLDVGGGNGTFLSSVASRHPHLELALFDLPPVVDEARDHLAAAGLDQRVTLYAGDFSRDPLPVGVDTISLIRVVHDHDDAQALALLRRTRDALPRGGRLVLAEPMAGTAGAEPAGDAYFGFYLLAMGQGRPRTEQALRTLLRRAGYGRVDAPRTRNPLLIRVLVARHD